MSEEDDRWRRTWKIEGRVVRVLFLIVVVS